MYANIIKKQRRFVLNQFRRFSTVNEPEVIIEPKQNETRQEEIIDIKPVKSENDKFKIEDVYTIKSKKLPERNILNFIDKTRITNPNVTFSNTYDRDAFNKDDFKEINPIPVSAKLGPFEVK